MFCDSAHPHQSSFDTHESRLRFGMRFAELWHEWFDTMSQVAYQTHRACEFLAENGGPSNGQYGQTQTMPARDGSGAGGSRHACRSDHAGHGSHAETKEIARERGRGACLVGFEWRAGATRAGGHEPSLVDSAIAVLGRQTGADLARSKSVVQPALR